MKERDTIRLAISREAKQVLTTTAAALGMKEQEVASRIYLWFIEQEDVVRKAVLKLLPEGYEVDVAKIALERIAKTPAKGKR